MAVALSRPDADLAHLAAGLLGRPADVEVGTAARELVAGRTVLVTGAGGSIGSELARQVHRLGPARLYLLDHDESALHTLQLDLLGHGLFDDDRVVLCDIRDRGAVDRLFARIRPDLVLHAAAHKHLPLLERYPAEGVKTNVFGSDSLVCAALDAGVERFVNVSTDKAARPTSMLGATKRLAEMLVAERSGQGTALASVRFGNVLGSRGSFLWSLAAQVRAGIPITVTDVEVTRFFMTIPEAARLVLEAAAMARRGETYVLDMGAPVRIVELVESYLRITGSADPGIVFTGLRPGEKLHEQLSDSMEVASATEHPGISSVVAVGSAGCPVSRGLPALARAVAEGDGEHLRDLVSALLPRAIGAERPAAAASALPAQRRDFMAVGTP